MIRAYQNRDYPMRKEGNRPPFQGFAVPENPPQTPPEFAVIGKENRMAQTAWIFSYKLRKNVTEEQFIEKTQRLHDEVISKAKGFLSWDHYRQGGTWTDFVLWETEEDAENATQVGAGKEVTEEFYACIQMHTCRALISSFVKRY